MFFGTELKVSTRLTAEQTCGNPWKTTEMEPIEQLREGCVQGLKRVGMKALAVEGTEDRYIFFCPAFVSASGHRIARDRECRGLICRPWHSGLPSS